MHGLAILEVPPQLPGYICTNQDQPGVSYECSPSQFCENSSISYEVDYSTPENFYNWTTNLLLVCKGKQATANIGLFAFAGVFVGCLFAPRLGDTLGRKPVYLFSMFASVPIIGAAASLKSLYVIYFAGFCIGPAIIARLSCGFLLLMEHVPRKYQATVGAVVMVSEGSCYILWALFLKWISQDALILLWVATGICLLTSIMTIFIPESPRYLYGINKVAEC